MSSTATTLPSSETNTQAATGCGGMDMPQPVQQHAWLQRFVGEWDADVEPYMGPDQPPMQMKGRTRVRMLGGFWMIEEGENLDMPYAFVFTVGYDVARGKYVGSWTDTMMGYLWRYEGSVDPSGRILTLETEGPNPMDGGRISKVRETTEFKTDDLRVLTSNRVNDDGTTTKIMTVTLRRRK